MPQLELGFPWFVYYQPLPALTIVALQRVLLGVPDLLTVFNVVRFLLLALFPLTVFWSLRRLGVGLLGAAVAAAMAPLLSGDFRYGFEYDSYVWRGFGMYPQLVAMHLSFVVLALLWTALQGGRARIALAAIALAALVASHLVYAYMMGITALVLVVVAATSRTDLARRAVRLVAIGVPATLLTAWLTLPFITQTAYFGASPYLQAEKYDSFGAPAILGWLVTGDLLDHGRLPVVTALLALGLVAAVATRTALARVALAGFGVWLVLYFGRPTLGPLVDLLPLHDGLLLHRFVGSVELFAIVLVGVGAAWVHERIGADAPWRRFAPAALITLLLLANAMAERAIFYGWNTRWMTATRDAIAADADARAIVDAVRAQPSGRVYAGLRTTGWGPSLDFGLPFNSVRLSDYLVFNVIPIVAAPYSSVSLNADLMWDFAETRREDYDLFDVRYVVAPSDVALPAFLRPLLRTARYTLYQAPTTGYATYGAILGPHVAASQRILFDINRRWFNGSERAQGFRRLYYPSYRGPGAVPPLDTLPACPRATYAYERAQAARLDLLVGCPNASTLVLKVTYHPNWHVLVDGAEAETFMVSPSFVGIALAAGDHFVSAEYRSTPLKAPLLVLGGATLLVLAALALPAVPARLRGRLAARRVVAS